MGLWGKEKAPHALEGIAALHVFYLLRGTLIHPNGGGMRIETVHESLDERRTSGFSCSP